MTGRVATGVLTAVVLIGAGCAGVPGDATTGTFATDRPVPASVVENVTACVVDAVCFLRLEFSDTTVVAVYGSGERPAPDCRASDEAADVAFGVEEGATVEVVLGDCGVEGLVLRGLEVPSS